LIDKTNYQLVEKSRGSNFSHTVLYMREVLKNIYRQMKKRCLSLFFILISYPLSRVQQMCSNHSFASILVPVIVGVMAFTIGLSALLTWRDSVFIGPSKWPYVSDLGNSIPSAYVFIPGFCISAGVLFLLSLVRYWQLQWFFTEELDSAHGRRVNVALLVFSAFGNAGAALLAIVSDKTHQTFHDSFTLICFVGLGVYQIMHTSLMLWITNNYSEYPFTRSTQQHGLMNMPSHLMFLWQWSSFLVSVIAGLNMTIAKLVSENGSPPVYEWILIGSTMFWFLPWFYDLKPMTIDHMRTFGTSTKIVVAKNTSHVAFSPLATAPPSL